MEAYRTTLLEILENRRMRNPVYSLRAFARSCGISSASMSQILSGKRPLTLKSAKRIAQRLALDPLVETQFVKSARQSKENHDSSHFGPRDLIEMDRFNAIADWYHYAILSLSELKGHRATPEWVADKLGISKASAKSALARLVRLGLLKINKNKTMNQVPNSLVTTNDIPSGALRKHNRQILERALWAQDAIPMQWREFGTITMAVDPNRIPQAKMMIRKFRQQLSAICENGERKIVYHFTTQFFPANDPDKFCNSKEYDHVEKTH